MFIRLTELNGRPIIIATHLIDTITINDIGQSVVSYCPDNGTIRHILIKETIDEVASKLCI